MAEMLTYAPDLRSITGGQGDYTMEFARYEEVPGAPGAEGDRGAQAEKEAVRARASRKALQPDGRVLRPLASEPPMRKELRPIHDAHLLRRLRAHDPQGRADRAVPRAGRPAQARVRAVRRPRLARGLDPRVRARRAAGHRGARRSEPRPLGRCARAAAQAAAEDLPGSREAPARRRRRAGRGARGDEPLRHPRAAGARAPRAAPRPQDPRHVRAVPTNAQVKVERALELFNSSEHTRTIAGIARTLGEPG